MQLRDLVWLVAIDEQRHLTDTAAVLGTSQPNLSRCLARVEAELGTRLFERVPDGVQPTPTGDLVIEAARELTHRYQQLVSDVEARLDPETGVVRLAFLDSMATSLVPRILRSFHAQSPRVRVELRQEPAHDILRDLATGAVDLAITSARPAAGGLGWHPVQEERLVVVVPPTHRLRQRRRVALEELEGEELVTTPMGFGHRSLVDSLFREAGVTLPVSFESQDLGTIEGLVAAGLGIGVVPEAFAGLSGTIGLRITTDSARRTIGLTWRTDRELSAPAERLRDFVMAMSP